LNKEVWVLQALRMPSGTIEETLGVFTTKDLAEHQWHIATKDDESVDSVRLNECMPLFTRCTLDGLLYT